MKAFAANLTLALLWAALFGNFDPVTIALGFVVGYAVLWYLAPSTGARTYVEKLPRAIGFIAFYLGDLLASTAQVAWDVVTPRAHRRPGIVAVPLDASSDAEITLLANLITLTPGTLALDVSDDRRTLYVHSLFLGDPSEFRATLKRRLERRVLELMR